MVRKRAGASEDRLEIRVAEVLSDVTHDMGEAAALEKEGVERELQELLADAPERCGEGFRLVRREWPTDIGPGGPHVPRRRRRLGGRGDQARGHDRRRRAAHPLPRAAGARARASPSCRGVLAAAQVKPQARVLAESRGIDCVEVDPAVLRGDREPDLTLFAG